MSTDQKNAALVDAAEVLETEANQLAIYLEKTLKTQVTLRTQEITSIDAMTPHRVAIAVRNERDRLREIATILRGMKKVACALCDRGDGQLGHAEDCPNA